MLLKKIADHLLPPLLNRWLGARAKDEREQAAFREFYAGFVKSGDLCFDIGANLGNRVRCFRAIGCRVVAVEPQASCRERLAKRFAADAGVILVPKAAGRAAGVATLHVSSIHVLSSMSDRFIRGTQESGRFRGVDWGRTEEVEVTTLDALIAEHGMPRFVKIDVEGHEVEVLAGLSQPVPALSFEWTPELYEQARDCIGRLMELGDYEFNLSWGESMQFSRPAWRSADSMLRVLEEFSGESLQFGDVYARLRAGLMVDG